MTASRPPGRRQSGIRLKAISSDFSSSFTAIRSAWKVRVAGLMCSPRVCGEPGTARRTTRRVVRRTAYTVAVLPAGCVYGNYYGGMYYNCAGVYYEQSADVYVQVVFE